jgi:cob(I)alamin adenosyltransferase
MKSETSNYGEERAARKLGIEMVPLGAGFTWLSKDLEHDKALAQRCWELCREKLSAGEHDIVILDEITYPISYGWLGADEVIETLRNRPSDVHVILTGRDAPQALIDYADLVTEMREIKHPFQQGIKAQPGLDF